MLTYLASPLAFQGLLRESKESLEVKASGAVSAEVALAWFRALSSTWTEADVPEAKAQVLHAIYERIVVTGRTIVSIRLTPSRMRTDWRSRCPRRLQWRARQVLGAR